ncbi:terpene synthase 10-like isoform X1 [Rhododendron vialii]|uniref:terpene synthase 10-like isoform X1 n=1 Tax=Rhododendron vialii TaxID=182163 RepID=UPI0026605086|nr:terpene synthase 10-like isoform X1 [Rhododendron vialii]
MLLTTRKATTTTYIFARLETNQRNIMALALTSTVPTSLYTHFRLPSQVFITPVKSIRRQVPHTVRCIGVSPNASDEKIVRRSGNWQPSIWDYDYVQSLNSKYLEDKYVMRATKLKEDVKKMLTEVVDPLDGLEIIDDLQRLGVFYHFEEEIKRVLESIYNSKRDGNEDGLHATSLKFRLLRQHGYNVPQDVFENFMDETGHFKASLCEDIRGMLYLYEASFLSFSGESIMEEAKDFATKNLEQYLKRKDIDQVLASLVSHALELPLHWRLPRLEARWFIDMCERRPNMNPTLLQLAKLDFNMVQATHQEDLKHASRWWIRTGLGKKLSFARDRLMENFLWPIGQNFKPQFSNFRRSMTVVNALITTIDDVYDVYGTLDELEIFTDAIERWDISVMEQLPDYMKICFLALFNSINEIAYETLKEQDAHIIPHLRKVWADLCKTYLNEAKWYYSGYTPTLEEYMSNAWISIGAPTMLTHGYFLCTNPINTDSLDWLVKYPDIMRWSATVLRLADDLGTSSDEMERGDNPKSIQCYMHETGASEEDARDHIKYLIGKTWEKMNEERLADSPFSKILVEIAMNIARVSQCMYQYGDGHSTQGQETKDRVLSLFINPVPLE